MAVCCCQQENQLVCLIFSLCCALGLWSLLGVCQSCLADAWSSPKHWIFPSFIENWAEERTSSGCTKSLKMCLDLSRQEKNTNESQQTWPSFTKRVGLEPAVGTKSRGSQVSFCLSWCSWCLLDNKVLHRTYILPDNLIWLYYLGDYFCLSMHASIFSDYIICPRWPMAQKFSFLKADA